MSVPTLSSPLSYYGSPKAGSSAAFTVEVPAGTQVFVNGAATKSTGTLRNYVSRGLTPGRTYVYEVRAEYEVDGRPVTDTKTIRLTTGSRESLVFGAPTSEVQVAEKQPRTKLSLRVPADAKVFLAGNETRSEGEHREFITNQLSAGSAWTNYVVRVVVDRDGRPVSQEKVITLRAGDDQLLAFDFGNQDKVASAR